MEAIIQWMRANVDRHAICGKALAVATVFVLVTAAHVLFFRPYQLHWGATAGEETRSIPGDELNPNPSFLATRAITIDGTREEIWPWLMQMGYGRAGFYGYDILENLGSPNGLRSAENILPEYQDLEVGDELPISAVVSMRFHTIEPHRHLIWVGDEEASPGAFTWALYPLDKNRTRLVSRIRWSYDWTAIGTLPLQLFTEFADHIAVRKILTGVKGRVEGEVEPMWVQNAEFFLFVLTFLIFIAALVLVSLRRLTWLTWSAALFAGVVWLTTWYAPVPAPLGALIALVAVGVLIHVFRETRSIPSEDSRGSSS